MKRSPLSIEKNIRKGIYRAGQKLPSVRDLKKMHHLSTTTVQHGYERLISKGLVTSIPKSGYYVSDQIKILARASEASNYPIVRDPVFTSNRTLISSAKLTRSVSEFNVATPGDLLIPQKLLLRTMQQVIRDQGLGLLRYYDSNGSADLKHKIISNAAIHRTSISPAELLITDGALQALYIALSSVCEKNDIIALESPCVFSVLEVARVLKLRVIEIPFAATVGFDIDIFHRACLKNNVKALVITPNFHNPTGAFMTNEQKQGLLSVAQQHGAIIIENDIYGDLPFNGERPATIKSFDESGSVMTYSSYAKTLAPGIRLGWLSAANFMHRAEQIKFALGSTVSPIYQETVNRLLSNTSYQRHIRAFRTQLAKNARFTINLLNESFPKGTQISVPQGGYSLWVKLPNHINIDLFYRKCQAAEIRFTPGSTFSFSNVFDHYFRVIFSDKYAPKKIQAIQSIGRDLI
ncbi:PLP-dependent aminotransferase family protein [Olivibacter sp. CPCC 100613]|uniref:aminotransferase-like domain-containing protein n=1 Tax=Olivibacter sp. CPCC 100613 TaxID=3079931 RepID=UPI002FF58310